VTTPLALSLGPTAFGSRAVVDIARRAGDLGIEQAWASEVAGPDAFTLLGAVATATDMALGVAVVPAQTRTAFALAMSALSLADLTGGRFTLGIGASAETLVTRFGGVSYDRPLRYVREVATALRPALAGERTTLEGEVVSIGGYRYPAPTATPVPLFIGSLNQQSLRMTGELADGLCLNQFGPQHLPLMLDEVRAGAAAAGRDLPGDFPVMARLFVAVTDDVPAARAMVRQVFAPYVANAGYNRFYRWMGYEEQAERIGLAAAVGDRAAMADAFTDDLVDDLFVLGDADTVATRIDEYVAAGVTIPALEILAGSPDEVVANLAAIRAARA
jgi:probable F420-dependent oxidoreductase